MSSEKIVTVLHIEDDPIDGRAVQRAFRKIGFENPMYVASDGNAGLKMLRGESGFIAIPQPRMILLDLRMNGLDGHQFLAELRADPKLQDTIVFILTTSDNSEDRQRAFRQHVAGYLLKENSAEDFNRNMQLICDYVRRSRFPPDTSVHSSYA